MTDIELEMVLASKSPARRQTLVSAGITPLVLVSHVDEAAVLDSLPGGRAFSGGSTTPGDEVQALAEAKCTTVAGGLVEGRLVATDTGQRGRLVVLGCDSMLELDGAMLGKPHTPDVATRRIREMRGREAVLWTGHHAVLLDGDGQSWTVTDSVGAQASTTVRFGDISDAEIDAYVASGEPLNVAGSFTVDGLGGPFVEGIEGDYHSVVGLSLPLVRRMLAHMGVFWPDLWDARR